MAKNTGIAKRKADADEYLPSRSKKTKRSKPISNDIHVSEEADDTFILEALTTYRKGTAKQARAELPDEENYVDKFKSSVDEKKRTLMALLDEKVEELSNQRHKASSDLASYLRESIFTPTPPSQADNPKATNVTVPPSAHRGQLTVTSHPYYQKSLMLSAESNAVLEEYEMFAKLFDSKSKGLEVGQKWARDGQKIVQLLEASKRYGSVRVRNLVVGMERGDRGIGKSGGDAGQESEKDQALVKEVGSAEGIWGSLCQADMGENGEQSWAEVARRTEKGVRRLIRCLPDEIDGGEWA